jgi:hypothetical protein
MSPVVRRLRGSLLRLVRRRPLSMAIGLLLILPAAWVQFVAEAEAWWLQGLSLVVGATGLALFWTGLTGASPDWIED